MLRFVPDEVAAGPIRRVGDGRSAVGRAGPVVPVAALLLVALGACSGDLDLLPAGSSTESDGSSPPALLSTEEAEVPLQDDGPEELTTGLSVRDTVGALRSPPEEVFGLVVDAETDPRGRHYLLDRRKPAIHVFSTEGTFLSSIGRAGAGPGEFTEPVAMDIVSDDELVVADADGRISRFRITRDSLVHERTDLVNYNPKGLCASHGSVFVQGPRQGGTIHRYGPDGEWEVSFGSPPEADNGIVRLTLSVAELACPDDRRIVAELPKFSPLLRIYRHDGSLVRVDTIPGYRPIRVTKATSQEARFDWVTPEGTHRALSLLPDGEGHLIVQLGVQDSSRTAANDYQAVVTHRYGLETGERRASGTGLPWILAWSERRVAGLVPLPYPQVLLMDRNGGS